MMLKLAIIAGLVILGGMIFYTEIDTFFPTTASTVPESLQADVSALGNQTTDFVAERLTESTVHLEKVANDTVGGITTGVQTVQDQVVGGASSLNPIEPIKDTLTTTTEPSDDEA